MNSKHIRISKENHKSLKKLGEAGDSFNDVVTDILEKLNSLQQSTGVPAPKIAVNSKQPYLK